MRSEVALMEPDDTPRLDDAVIETMARLKEALDDGNYDEEFDKLFPPEKDAGPTD
jgi:hypothetical protein